MLRILKIILVSVWVTSCVVLLVSYTQHAFESPDRELSIQFGLQMAVLTFPLGYVVGLVTWFFLWELLVGLFLLAPLDIVWPDLHSLISRVSHDYGFIPLWFAMTAAGYYQWFVWLPKNVSRCAGWIRSKWGHAQPSPDQHPDPQKTRWHFLCRPAARTVRHRPPLVRKRPEITVLRYRFTGTTEDLLEAESAERSATSSICAPLRWVIVFFGILWLVMGAGTLRQIDPGPPEKWKFLEKWVLGIAWIALGTGVLRHFVIRPYSRRNRIKKSRVPQKDLLVVFDDDNIKFKAGNASSLVREWQELTGFAVTPKGIILYFSNGMANWLPDRVFSDESERDGLVEFIQSHQIQRQNE